MVLMKVRDNRLASSVNPGAARLLPLAAALLALLVLILVSLLGFSETRETMTAVRLAGATAAARSIRTDLNRAIGYGVPLIELPGVEPYLQTRLGGLPELRFFLVTGSNGQRLHQAGISAEQADALLAQWTPQAMREAESPEGLTQQGIDPFVLVRLPLVNGNGAVLAAVEPAEITRTLIDKIMTAWPFWVGCLLLALAWATVAERGGVVEPLSRLAAAMRAAGEGCFDRLLIRRARDGVGQCLLTFNALVAGLHARRQGVIAQAEDVRHAVFDQEVAASAMTVRDAALADLGEGLATAPTRCHDPRASDADLFALAMAAAGMVGSSNSLLAGAPSLLIPGVILGTLLPGLGLGWLMGGRRWLTASAAALLVAATLYHSFDAPEGTLALVMDAISGGAVGLAWGVALRQRRLARLAAGIGGGLWVMVAGSLAGVALAWSFLGESLALGVCATLLAVISLAGALTAPGQKG
jgi:hypothetical protein